jgi:hypothetical protein
LRCHRWVRPPLASAILFLISGKSFVLRGPSLPSCLSPCQDPTPNFKNSAGSIYLAHPKPTNSHELAGGWLSRYSTQVHRWSIKTPASNHAPSLHLKKSHCVEESCKPCRQCAKNHVSGRNISPNRYNPFRYGRECMAISSLTSGNLIPQFHRRTRLPATTAAFLSAWFISPGKERIRATTAVPPAFADALLFSALRVPDPNSGSPIGLM